MNGEHTKAYLALAVVCTVWGTTYLGMRIGVETFPPLLFSGIRHTSAALVLFLFLRSSGRFSAFSSQDLVRQAIPGILMIALGNGVIGWSERYIPSGLAALITSVMPVYVVGINFASGIDRKLPHRYVLLGLLLGLAGILLIFRDNLSDLGNPGYLTGTVLAFTGCLAWAAGSIFAKHKPTRSNALSNATIQLGSGGISLLAAGLVFDNTEEFRTVSAQSVYALLYLIVFGSLLTFACYLYALEKLPVGLVSIYAYINPFIALGLGAAVLNEKVTALTALALLTTLSGIYFINKGYAISKPQPA